MCGIRGERKGERAVRMFPLWKAVLCLRNGMFKCQCRTRPGCCLLFTLNSILSSQKRKKQSEKLNSEAVFESERMSFSPWHIYSKPQTVHAWFLFLWFSVLGLHVFCSRWVSKSFIASVKYAIMLLNVLNVPKHGQGFAKQAWFGQRSFHFWGLERCISCSYLSVILSAWRMNLQARYQACLQSLLL